MTVCELTRERLAARFDECVRSGENGVRVAEFGLFTVRAERLEVVPGDRWSLNNKSYCRAIRVVPGDVPVGRWPTWLMFAGDLYTDPKVAEKEPGAAIYCCGEYYVLALR